MLTRQTHAVVGTPRWNEGRSVDDSRGQAKRLPNERNAAQDNVFELRRILAEVARAARQLQAACPARPLKAAKGVQKAVTRSIVLLQELCAGAKSASKEVLLACCVVEAGVLVPVAEAMSCLDSILHQRPQRFSLRQQQELLDAASCIVHFVTSLVTIWPQSVLRVKAFEPALLPWAKLAATLIEPSNMLSSDRRQLVSAAVAAAACLGMHIADALEADVLNDVAWSIQQSAGKLFLSEAVHKLLMVNITFATRAQHMLSKGVSPLPVLGSVQPSSSTSSTAGSGQSPATTCRCLLVPAHHKLLLQHFGIDDASVNGVISNKYCQRHTQASAAVAFYNVEDFRAAVRQPCSPSKVQQSAGTDSLQQPRGGACNTRLESSCSSSATTGDSGDKQVPDGWEHSSRSSDGSMQLSLLLVLIEYLATLPEFSVGLTFDLLHVIQHRLCWLASKDGTGHHVLPPGAAAAVLRAYLQQVAPILLHQLCGAASTTADDRQCLLQANAFLLDQVLPEGAPEDIANCLHEEPLVAVVALQTALRTFAELASSGALTAVTEGGGRRPFGLGECCINAPPITCRIVLALRHLSAASQTASNDMNSSKPHHQNSTSSNNLNPSEFTLALQLQPQLQDTVVSLVSTCLKSAATAIGELMARLAAVRSLQGMKDCICDLCWVLSHVVTIVDVGYWLGSAIPEQQQQEQEQEQQGLMFVGNTHSERSLESSAAVGDGANSSCKDCKAPAATVLVARSLLLISTTVQQALGAIDGLAVSEVSESKAPGYTLECVVQELQPQLSAQSLTASNQAAVVWLGKQFSMLYGTIHADKAAAAGSNLVANVSQHSGIDERENILLLQQEAASWLSLLSQQLDASCSTAEDKPNSKVSMAPLAVIIAQLVEPVDPYFAQLRQTWDTCWQVLNKFASSVCGSLPLSSCCNNPLCLNLDKLSEQQLVGGKSCVCAACSAARYCSKHCQKQHWKHHKRACRKLQHVQDAATAST